VGGILLFEKGERRAGFLAENREIFLFFFIDLPLAIRL
jgi:hypothetical protein